MAFEEISLLVTGALGVAGWWYAVRSRGQTLDTRKELEAALEAGNAAKGAAVEAAVARAAAEVKYASELARADKLVLELETERKSRQALVDALAKSGAPVGDAIVGSALDGLYPNGDKGSQGAGSGGGGDQSGVPGQPAGITGAASKR